MNEETDPFKNAMMFWEMCPHHYTNEDLYQAFKSRLQSECSVVDRMTQEEWEEWKNKMVEKVQ